MRITIVMGFFLPMPPVAGGATEKSWHRLAQELVKLGHEITIISRQWAGSPNAEHAAGIHHVRLPGFDHGPSLMRNLFHDFRWSRRVLRALPPADVTVSNAVLLPIWLGRNKHAGRVVVMPGRMPKGQFGWYGRIDRVLAVSRAVENAVLLENPNLAGVTRAFGYPIDYDQLARARSARSTTHLTIGYIGRIHPEKGLDLLVAALAELGRRSDVPPWRAILCGPTDVQRGGAGASYARTLEQTLSAALPRDQFEFRPPAFDEQRLASIYGELDIFCYPSLAARGETFGLAVVEAMASGAVPVVSQLACFTDFVEPERNGEIVDQGSPTAVAQLVETLTHLLTDPDRRARLSADAQNTARRYDAPKLARQLDEDFSTLN